MEFEAEVFHDHFWNAVFNATDDNALRLFHEIEADYDRNANVIRKEYVALEEFSDELYNTAIYNELEKLGYRFDAIEEGFFLESPTYLIHGIKIGERLDGDEHFEKYLIIKYNIKIIPKRPNSQDN